MSRDKKHRIRKRMNRYVATHSIERRLERYTTGYQRLGQQAAVRVRLVQYVART